MTYRDTGHSHVLDEMIDRIGQKVEAARDAQRVDSRPTADKPDRNGPGTIEPSGGAHFRNHLQPHPAALYRDDHDDWDPPWIERVPRSACWDEHTYLMMNDLHPAKLIDGETWIDCDEQEQPPAGEKTFGQTHV